jgi:hypothetical protein
VIFLVETIEPIFLSGDPTAKLNKLRDKLA